MRGFHALFIVILISASVLFATQIDELGNRINTDHKISRQTAHRYPPEWYFHHDPIDIFDTCCETFSHPNGTPAHVQDNGGLFFLFHAEEVQETVTREYLAYINYDCSLNSINYVSQDYVPEGPGGMALDPDTQDAFYVWESYTDDNPYPDIMLGMDVWHLLQSPGLISTPFTVFDQHDPDEFPEFVASEKHFYRNPDIMITHAPSYWDDGKRRLYVIAYQPHSDNISPVAIAYCDFASSNIESGTIDELDWNYITDFPIENYGNQPNVKTHFAAACNEEGTIGIVGWKEGSWEDLPPEQGEFFVLYNDNYGEGEWEYHETNLEMYVESPLNESGVPWLQFTEQLHFSPVYAGNFNAILDDWGYLHVQMPFTLRGLQLGEPTVWPLLSQVRNVLYDGWSHEFTSSEIYPRSDVFAVNEPFLPWDEDKDGDVDHYDPETGHVIPICAFPWQYPDIRYAQHRNSMKNAHNDDEGWMACVWMDGVKSLLAQQEGEYAPPEMMIGCSDWSGHWWYDPIVLSPDPDNSDGNYVEQLEGQIPSVPILGNRIENLGDGYGKFGIFYLDEYEHGPSGDWGGALQYMELEASFSLPCTCSVKNDLTPIREIGNHPNPFNPSTTISFNLAQESPVTIEVFNILGQKVKTLMNDMGIPGTNSVVWNGTDDSGKNISSGIYLYRLKTDRQTATKKMLLLE